MDLTDIADTTGNINYAAISATAGDNSVVSAVSGKSIWVVQVALFADGDAVIRFEDGTGGTALTGQMQLFAKSGSTLDPGASTGHIVLPFSPCGWFRSSVNTLLNLELSGSNVNGVIGYLER